MITVDDWHGQVQEIGIRNTTIRDLILEDVKIMNNSTIRSIINYSERPCWSPITVGVDYDTDIPALEAAFEREKAGMKKNIPLGIGEIVYLGIDELSGSQMTLKFQILCRNQDQLKVKRALNREVRLMLARNGFIIPFPQVTISTRKNREEDEEEEMEREKGVEVANDKGNSLANLLSILKILVIYVIGTFVLGFCMVYFSGVIEVAVEILLYLLCVAFLAVGFIVGGLA